MKKHSLNFAQQKALAWYEEDPSYFDTASNNDWFVLYMQKWLGVHIGWHESLISMRMKQMSYESFRRATQYLIQHGYIKLSEEHMKKRRRVEVETRETILAEPVKTKQWIFNEHNQTYREVLA